MGGQRQRSAPDAGPQSPTGRELHALRDRRPEQQHGARAQLGPRLQLAELRAAEAGAVSYGRRLLVDAAPVSERAPGRLRPVFRLPRRAHRQRRSVSNRSRTVHQPERHPRRHRQPDESVGSPLLEGRLLLSAQLQAAEHLRELQQPDRFHGQLEQPVRHGAQLRERRHGRVQFLSAGLEVRAPRMALQEHRVVRAGQLEAHGPVHARLRRAVLRRDAAVGHDAAGLEFPARPVRSKRGGEALYDRCASAGRRARAACGAGWIRRSSPRA